MQPDVSFVEPNTLPASVRTKLARFCNVAPNAVIESIDADTIYDVPLLMQEERFDEVVLGKLGMDGGVTEANLHEWKDFLQRYKTPSATCVLVSSASTWS